MSGIIAVSYFIFTIIFSFMTFLLWIRIAMRYFRVSTLHPICMLINRITNPFVRPLSQYIDTNKNRLSRYDWSTFCVLVAVLVVKFILLSWLFLDKTLPFVWIIIYTIANLITQPCDLLFYAILIRVIMSWINPTLQHPLMNLIRLMTEPLLRVGRRVIPDISGFDFSPFIMMIVLKIITIFINASLPIQLI